MARCWRWTAATRCDSAAAAGPDPSVLVGAAGACTRARFAAAVQGPRSGKTSGNLPRSSSNALQAESCRRTRSLACVKSSAPDHVWMRAMAAMKGPGSALWLSAFNGSKVVLAVRLTGQHFDGQTRQSQGASGLAAGDDEPAIHGLAVVGRPVRHQLDCAGSAASLKRSSGSASTERRFRGRSGRETSRECRFPGSSCPQTTDFYRAGSWPRSAPATGSPQARSWSSPTPRRAGTGPAPRRSAP